MKSNRMINDMPHLRKKLEKVDEQRLKRIKEAKENGDFRSMIELWAEENASLKSKILSDKQRMAIYLMTDFVHNFSNKYIITRLGIPESEFYKWRNDPLFLRELDREITRRRSFIRIHAFRNVHRAIIRGSMKDTWNYLKMSGDLTEKHEVIDRTGEKELDNNELNNEISKLIKQVAEQNTPSDN